MMKNPITALFNIFKTDWNKKLIEASKEGNLVGIKEALDNGANLHYKNKKGETAQTVPHANNTNQCSSFLADFAMATADAATCPYTGMAEAIVDAFRTASNDNTNTLLNDAADSSSIIDAIGDVVGDVAEGASDAAGAVIDVIGDGLSGM